MLNYGVIRGSKHSHGKLQLRAAAMLLIAVLAGLLVVQTVRAAQAGGEVKELSALVSSLTTQVGDLTKKNEELANLVPPRIANDSFDYQNKYPDMVVKDRPAYAPYPAHTIYLTFDDGPSKNTAIILDALKAQNAKATFFVIGQNIAGHEDLLQRIVEEGHTIAIHTYSHVYRELYASVDAFLDDFHKTYTTVYDACGVYPTLFRFPGGSINSYNAGNYQQIIAEMLRRGFIYYDWNVSSEDAGSDKLSSVQISANVLEGVKEVQHPMVLLHDSNEKTASAQAVSQILTKLTAEGYTFAPLDASVQPVTFGYKIPS